MTWTDVGVAVAVVGTAATIVREIVRSFQDSRKDKHALEVAREQQPKIMEQLDAGNFQAAAQGLAIAQTVMAEALATAQAEIARLKDREQALEVEAQGWEHRAQEARDVATAAEARAAAAEKRAARTESLHAMLTERCDRMERELRSLQAGEGAGP